MESAGLHRALRPREHALVVPVEADDGALAPAALRRPRRARPRRGCGAGGTLEVLADRARGSGWTPTRRARVLAAPRPRAPRGERRRERCRSARAPSPRASASTCSTTGTSRLGERRAPRMPPGLAPGRLAPRDRLGVQVAPLGPRRGGARRPPLHPPRARRAASGRGLHARPRLLRLLPRLPGRPRLLRLARRGAAGGSDVFPLPRPLNTALLGVQAVERALLRVGPLPFGSSVVLVARKAAA